MARGVIGVVSGEDQLLLLHNILNGGLTIQNFLFKISYSLILIEKLE